MPKLPDKPLKRSPSPEEAELTAEEIEEFEQETSRNLEALRLELEDYREKVRLGVVFPLLPSSITNPASTSQSGHIANSLSQFSEADPQRYERVEPSAEDPAAIQNIAPRTMYRVNEKPLRGGKAEDVKQTSLSTYQDDLVGDLQSDIEKMNTERERNGHDDSILLLYQQIQAMRLRRNSRQGIALHRHEDAAAELSPSTGQSEHVEEIQSMIQVKKKKLTAREVQESKRLFHLKLEALDLRRNGPRGTPLRQSEDRVTRTSRSTIVPIKSSILRGCHGRPALPKSIK